MKKILVLIGLTTMLSGNVMAQRRQMTDEERAKQRAEMIEKQTERMVKDLKLEGEAKEAFVKTYTEYQTELQAVQDDVQQRRNRDEEDVTKMTDEECYAKVTESLERQEKQISQSQKRLEITKKYMATFMPTLTAQQMYKVFGQRQRMGMQGMNGQGMRPMNPGMNSRGGFGGGHNGGF